MSYPFDNDFRNLEDQPPQASKLPPWAFGLVLAIGGMVLVIVGMFMLPSYRKHWLESDPNFLLKMRTVEARAEADLAFRKREAELKAESEAAGRRLEKIEIPPSPLREVVAHAAPAVVNITSSTNFLLEDPDGERRRPRLRGNVEMPRSQGAGVIVRLDDGKQAYVLTNEHVVRGADRLTIMLSSGRTVNAERANVWTDRSSDLAVVKFDASGLDHLAIAEFGDSDEVQPGDWVLAIGSPFGLKQSVTFGIVSAKGRVGTGIVDDGELLQTDVAINPGNSGGPLLDLKGRVIGINSAIVTGNGANMGVGFAIPSNMAQLIFEKLSQPPHKISRGFMGVWMDELSDSAAAKLGVPGGVLVHQVSPALPAAEAGMKAGDVIVRFDRMPVNKMQQLRKLVMDTPPNTTVSVDVIRLEDDHPTEITLRITLVEKAAP